MIHKTVSLADQIFEKVESDILSEKYTRGEVITELKLCDELNVSRTPVREALRRLEQEHLIEDTGKGMVVIGISLDDANSIYTIRERIEGLAAAECARNATEDQIKELIELVDLQAYYSEKGNSEKVREMDSAFHQAVYKISGSAVLYDTLIPLHRKIQKFRLASVQSKGRAKESTEEHHAVITAISERNADAADAMMTAHVKAAHKRLIDKLTAASEE